MYLVVTYRPLQRNISTRDAMSQLNVFASETTIKDCANFYIFYTCIDKELEGEGEKRHDCLSRRVAAGKRTA